MPSKGIEPDFMTYTAVFNCCTRCLNWEVALDLYEKLSAEIKSDVKLLAVVHECLVKCD